MPFELEQDFIQHLPGDPDESNQRRQVHGATHAFVRPKRASVPKLLHYSSVLAQTLGISEKEMQREEMLNILSGNMLAKGSKPYAMAYGGHQFGHWAGQLGDGRAINLGELITPSGPWALQLKGAGPTPFSRTADGLAVLRSSVREHLCSEAMFHLGVPTTRSLSLVQSGDEVMRDVMYDGHSDYEKGAIVCRVAPSFIRFGNFQLFASRKETDLLQQLADYTIDRHFDIISSGKDKYLDLLRTVLDRTIDLIVHWQRVGFVHGVMNSDNMSIHGLTIDYGPYGWLENYDPEWTPNTTDRQNKRYRFGNQAYIGLWNVFQLANALYPLIGDAKPLEDILNTYNKTFAERYIKMMHNKLGLHLVNEKSTLVVNELEKLLPLVETDMTIFFRLLGGVDTETSSTSEVFETISEAFYSLDQMNEDIKDQWIKWLNQYQHISSLDTNSMQERQIMMNAQNPKYVLRNWMAQLAIDKADEGDYSLIEEFYKMLQNPYTDQVEYDQWFAKRPEWARHKVGCSMLSCSS